MFVGPSSLLRNTLIPFADMLASDDSRGVGASP